MPYVVWLSTHQLVLFVVPQLLSTLAYLRTWCNAPWRIDNGEIENSLKCHVQGACVHDIWISVGSGCPRSFQKLLTRCCLSTGLTVVIAVRDNNISDPRCQHHQPGIRLRQFSNDRVYGTLRAARLRNWYVSVIYNYELSRQLIILSFFTRKMPRPHHEKRGLKHNVSQNVMSAFIWEFFP